ncbi:Panacea domain-containing protein [Micromonosporaceae bacterium Da 78-11]
MSANSVIAAMDARRPGLKLAKKHSLLFFAQGHHIAHFGVPLFDEPIVATDRGVSVPDADSSPAEQPDSEGPLNTIGYVVERYGSLSPADLRALIQAAEPWQLATLTGGVVNVGALRDWFLRDDETDDPDDERPNRAERAQADEIWAKHKAAR